MNALSDTEIKVVGVGGVDSGERLLAMHAVGASGVQIGTAYGERKAKVFSDVIAEAEDLLQAA